MKKLRTHMLLFGSLSLFFYAWNPASATLIVDGTDTVNLGMGDSYSAADLRDDSTTNVNDGGTIGGQVDMSGNASLNVFNGGTVAGPVSTFNNAVITVEGGTFLTADAVSHLRAFTELNISGGTLGSGGTGSIVYLQHSSQVNVTGGDASDLYQFFSNHTDSVLTISGGTVNRIRTAAVSIGGGTVNISGGTVEGLLQHYSGTLNITGGTFNDNVESRGGSTTNIYGGTWNGMLLSRDTTANVYIHIDMDAGYTFTGSFDEDEMQILGNGTLTATYSDGTPFEVTIRRQSTSAPLGNVYLIPEPGAVSLVLIGFAGLLAMYRRRKD